ncbi:MAG: universal stress protein [Pseudomonadota bacterium]
MDKTYSHLLAAIELNDGGERVLKRARDLAKFFNARLSVVHAVEYLPMDAGESMIAAPVNLTEQMQQQAREQLSELCQQLDLPPEAAIVAPGGVVAEILRLSAELNIDLIVIGHQQRRGLAALFSHTDESVVHRAPCDVMVLNIPSAA